MRLALLLASVAFLMVSSCAPRNDHRLDTALIAHEFPALAAQARPGVLGAAVLSLDGGEIWTSDAERPMPMASLFMAPLGAAVLGAVDRGRLTLNEVITLRGADLSPPYSPIADAFPATSSYTVGQLLERAVAGGDNTAADVLMSRIGGPGSVTAWLHEKGIHGIRVDRFERDIQPALAALPSFRPEWKGPAFEAMRAIVPLPARRAAIVAYLADPRDTMSTQGALDFLTQLRRGQLLSPASTTLLLRIMTGSHVGQNRIRAALPPGASFAHAVGAGTAAAGLDAASNDIGVVTYADDRHYVMAVFLSGSTADAAHRDALIADTARLFVRAAH